MALGSMLGTMGMAGVGSLGSLFVRITADSTGLVRGVNQAETTIAGGVARMGRQIGAFSLAATGAFVAIGAVAVREFAKFDKAMTESTAIMGNMSVELRRELEQTARSIAKNSIKSAEELARSYFYLASAGLTAEQSIAALPVVTQFAVAGAFDMAKATDLITDAQSALGLTVKDTAKNMENMTRVSDVLVKANTLANATVEQFSTSLTTEAGAALKAFNIDIEEGVAVLAAFADQGVKSQVAGTGLSRVLRLVSSAAVSNADAYVKHNIAIFDSAGKIRNLADIVGDLERALIPMSDQMRVATLEQLGFQARVQGVILPLLGTSQKIRDYEKALREAGGTTQDVADKQMTAFSNQLLVTQNRLKDILITIGEGLEPTLRKFNEDLGELINTNDQFNESLKANTEAIAQGFVFVGKIISTIYTGWMGLIRTVSWAALAGAETILTTYVKVFQEIKNFINAALADIESTVNAAIGVLNQLILAVPGFAKKTGLNVMSGVELKVKLPDVTMEGTLAGLREQKQAEWDKLAALFGQGTKAVAETVKQAEQGAKSYQHWSDNADRLLESEKARTIQLANQRALADEAMTKMLDQAEGELGMSKTGKSARHSVLRQFEDPAMFQAEQLRIEQEAAEYRIKEIERLYDAEVGLTEEVEKRKLAIIQEYQDKINQVQIAKVQFALLTSSRMFEDLAYISEQFAGRQSGIFKAMFAASKAFAIAESIIKIQQGIANAASLPFPGNLAAIASVVAATANIVSNIQAVKLEFAGKREFGGPVQAGKAYEVGERGRELFVPNRSGTIIPNDELQGGNIRVVINNYTDAQPVVTEREENGERVVEVMIRKVNNEIANGIREGRGDVTRAMEQTFSLRRGIK